MTSGTITIALDGEQALKKSSSEWPLSPNDADFDLLTDIRAKIRKLPIKPKWQWIEGHQDDHRPIHHLDPLAQDNIMADALAKHQLNECGIIGFNPTPQRFGTATWGSAWARLDF